MNMVIADPQDGEEHTYEVILSGTATTYVTVTAKNATDAVNAAEDLVDDSLCWHCANPQGSFGNAGPVEREYPGYMEVAEVRTGGSVVDPDDY